MDTLDTLPPLPSHPEHGWIWTDAEKRAIEDYGAACAAAERERCAKLCEDNGPELLRWWGDGQANAACQECAAAIRGTYETVKSDTPQ